MGLNHPNMVLLKSRVGSHLVKRREQFRNNDGVVERYRYREFNWNFDNDFKCEMPREVWSELEHEFLDRRTNLRYKDAFIEL